MAVALSGGKDSSALLIILDYLRRHSHLQFHLHAVHVTMGLYDTSPLEELCQKLEVPFQVVKLEVPAAPPLRGLCSLCARLKRGAMARALQAQGIRKLALGHHADDVADTLLMNLSTSGAFRSMSPKVALSGAPVELIRPLVYLREATLKAIHARAGLGVVGNTCPFGQGAPRSRARHARAALETTLGIRNFSLRAVAALERAGVWELGTGGARPLPPRS